jgi:thiol-disulfide isomerase/thioredoxin
MVKVGSAWRLLDAPGAGDVPPSGTGIETVRPPTDDPVLAEALKKVSEYDKTPPPPVTGPGANPPLAEYYKKRVALIEQVLAKVAKAEEREVWTKQIADNLGSAAQASPKGDTAALQRLTQMATEAEKAAPGSSLAGYLTFRKLWAEYAGPISTPSDELPQWQAKWMTALEKYVQTYPKSEDTPDALIQMAMSNDYGGKEKEEIAKRWYQQLVANFPNHPLAAKAKGSIDRLELVGRPLKLSAPTLTGQAYDVAQHRGKVIVVYYWASLCKDCIGDFARLKQLQASYGSKGLEIVGVNLDDRAEDAKAFLASHPLAAPHLFQATEQAAGLNGPLATQYGIMGLPTLFLVGKDGNVLNRSLQINELEDALKKAL